MVEHGSVPSLADDPALGLDRRTKLEILGAVLLGLFLGTLDQTVMAVALPRIVTDLGGNDLYTWAVTIYLLTSTISVPFYGKLSDLYGRKTLLMIGITLFLLGSVLSGLSQEMWQLIVFRGIQGLGAGSLFPIALAIVGDMFTPAERGRYQGLFGAMFGIAFLVGPGLGGFLTDSISWRWIFYVNLPIGALSLYLIWRLLPNVRRPGATRDLDYLGGLVFTVAIGFLLVGLTNRQTSEWTDATVGGFVAIALALTAVFVLVESRAQEPIVPLHLWRDRTYASSLVATFLVSFGLFGALIFLPRWYQIVRGSSATASGYELFPILVGLIGSSVVSGQIVARTRRYKWLTVGSVVIMAAGLTLMAQLRADTPIPVLWAWMFIVGVGIGPGLAVFTIIVQNAVPFRELGVATSNLTFFRQIGGSVGLAICGTAFGTSLRNELPGQIQPVVEQVIARVPLPLQAQAQAAFKSGGLQHLDMSNLTGVGQDFGQAIVSSVPAQFQAFLEPFGAAFDAAFNRAFSLAVGSTFSVAAVAAVAAIVAALVMRELPLRTTLEPDPAPAAPGPGIGLPEDRVTTELLSPGSTG